MFALLPVSQNTSESNGKSAVSDRVESKEYRDFWVDRFNAVGATRAYDEFKNINETLPIGTQHLASHVIGGVLYQQEGLEGIVVCDAHFGFGCFHGFFGIALASEGISSIQKLDAACVSRYGPLGTGCMHGIGHGILEYYGYDRINEALLACEDTTQLVSILGCTSGVFMEYNTPLSEMENGGLVTLPRVFDDKNSYGPCDRVGNQYKESCYFELGAWWALSMGSAPDDWNKMEQLCTALEENNFSYCVFGVGYALASMNSYDIENSTQVCDGMNELSRIYCRAGAHWALYANPKSRDSASALCDLFDGQSKSMCLRIGRPDLWVEL